MKKNDYQLRFCPSESVQSLLSNKARKARRMNYKLVFSSRSQFFHSRLFFSSQAKLRSTTQRLGITLKVCSLLRLWCAVSVFLTLCASTIKNALLELRPCLMRAAPT